MSARAAQWNPLSLMKMKSELTGNGFDSRITDPLIPVDQRYSEILTTSTNFDCLMAATRRFLVFSQSTNNFFNNAKYILLQIWNNAGNYPNGRELAVKVQQARTNLEFAEMFGVPWIEDKYCSNILEDLEE